MDRTRPILLPLLFALASVASVRSAVAADSLPLATSAQSPEDRKRADDFFRTGNKLYTAGSWAEAEAALRSAWELNPTFDVAANLGHTEYRLGKYRDAADYLAIALRGAPLVGKQEPRELAKKRLDEVRPLIGALHIQVNVAGATVLVDGKAVGQAPLRYEVFVEPGMRNIEAQLAGYEMVQQAVDVARGDDKTVALALAMPKPGPPTGGGPRMALLVAGWSTAALSLMYGVGVAALAKRRTRTSSIARSRDKAGAPRAARRSSRPTPGGCTIFARPATRPPTLRCGPSWRRGRWERGR